MEPEKVPEVIHNSDPMPSCRSLVQIFVHLQSSVSRQPYIMDSTLHLRIPDEGEPMTNTIINPFLSQTSPLIEDHRLAWYPPELYPICDRIWENPPYGIFSEN